MSGQLSAFAPFGGIVFSSAPSEASQIYDAQQTALGPAFQGEVDSAETYADAMCFGVAKRQLIAAGQQDDPDNATYLLDPLEKDYRIFPLSTASEHDRRATLKAAILARNGSYASVVTAGLTNILGSLFIHWRPMNYGASEVTSNTTYPAFSPPPTVPFKLIKTLDRIFPGLRMVGYVRVQDDGNPILIGEKIMIDAGANGIEEAVTVIGTYAYGGLFWLFAMFVNTHEPNVYGCTSPFVRWNCNQRHSMVVVDTSVLSNPFLLNQVHEFMRKTMPVVSTWIVCNETSAGYVGPFNVGQGLIGQTPINNVALPH